MVDAAEDERLSADVLLSGDAVDEDDDTRDLRELLLVVLPLSCCCW